MCVKNIDMCGELFKFQGILHFLNVCMFGICMSFVDEWLFIYLIDELGATTAVCGVSVGM